MKKYESIESTNYHELIDCINKFYTCDGWRIINIVHKNGFFYATLERDQA